MKHHHPPPMPLLSSRSSSQMSPMTTSRSCTVVSAATAGVSWFYPGSNDCVISNVPDDARASENMKQPPYPSHCEACGGVDFEYQGDVSGVQVCTECGLQRPDQVYMEPFAHRDIDRVNVTVKFSYERLIHFRVSSSNHFLLYFPSIRHLIRLMEHLNITIS